MGSLFGSKPEAPAYVPPPVLEPVKPMPKVNDDAVREARRRSVQAQQSRSGRQSTVLSQGAADVDTLGG